MTQKEDKKICGIVMPISTIDGCNDGHWKDVLGIIEESIQHSGFEGNLVSNADDVGIIQKRIIQNLYENPIVICDVSGKNPNVMFELGMRLAFDKPTIIIKDDKTSYSFDTAQIEHIEYPRDLRFSKIVDFKNKLAEKIKATFEKSTIDTTYTTFLKHFGEFKVAKIDNKEVSGQEFIIEELKNIRDSIMKLETSQQIKYYRGIDRLYSNEDFDYCMGDIPDNLAKKISELIMSHPSVTAVNIRNLGDEHKHLSVFLKDVSAKEELELIVRNMLPKTSRRKYHSFDTKK